MEALLSQLSLLAEQAVEDKDFDASKLDDVMRLFEVEAYSAWSAASEADFASSRISLRVPERNTAEAAEREAEDLFTSLMDAAMEEIRKMEAAAERPAEEEVPSLVLAAAAATKAGQELGAAAAAASRRYIDAAQASAAATVRSAEDGTSMTKVHPS